MPHFHYQGRNKFGDLIEGVIEAHHEGIVATHLSRLEITPVAIKKTAKKILVKDLPKWVPFWRPKDTELSLFAKQMHSLLKGGVPINRALIVVIESSKNVVLRNALTNIILDLESGYPLARCFQKQGFIFPDFFTAMIDVGENTGKLEDVFLQIHYYLETDIITKKRIKSALRYPLIVLSAIVFALIVINFFVVPAFKGFFDSMDATLPGPTRLLIFVSDFSLAYWWLGILMMIVGVMIYLSLINKPRYRAMWDKAKLKLPIVGSIIHRAIMARLARSLAMALKSGLPLMEAIHVVAKSTDNQYITMKVLHMTKGLEHGESLSQTAKTSRIFSSMTIQMLMVAEETGNMDDNLLEVAQYYEEDVDYDIKRLNDMLEPILIGVIAVLVLILALGVFLPLWDLSAVAMNKIRN